MKTRSAQPTLKDVARDAGVSVSTVSKALNNRFDVASATRARVAESVARLGYAAPAALDMQALTRTIEFVYDLDLNAYVSEVLAGALSAATSKELDVVVRAFPRGDSPKVIASRWASDAERTARLGLVFLAASLTRPQLVEFDAAGIPVVLIDPVAIPISGFHSIAVNHSDAATLATTHLVDLGHREIAYIGGPNQALSESGHLEGFKRAMKRFALQVLPGQILHGEYTVESGYRMAQTLLGAKPTCTAIVTSSDSLAQGVLKACWELGIRVPQDVSVIGFDDAPGAENFAPGLTTVRQPLQEMGALAVNMALALASGKQTPKSVELPVSLVVRQSTAKRT